MTQKKITRKDVRRGRTIGCGIGIWSIWDRNSLRCTCRVGKRMGQRIRKRMRGVDIDNIDLGDKVA